MKILSAVILSCFVAFFGIVVYWESSGELQPQTQVLITTATTPTLVTETTVPSEVIVPETTVSPATDPSSLESLLMPVNEFLPSNEELQHYIPEQAQIRGHDIFFTALYQGNRYFSGKVESNFSFLYGDFAFRITPIYGNGLFPAIWMLPASGAPLPELDIYESIGNSPDQFNGVLHFTRDNRKKRDFFTHYFDPIPQSYVLRFHWDKDRASWYLDGKEIYTITENLPQEPMYFIMNLAVGGGWAEAPTDNSIFPVRYHLEVLEFAPRNVGNR